jgi:hypothetical protein
MTHSTASSRFRDDVLRSIRERGPVTKKDLAADFPRQGPLDAAISYLWRNGYLERGWRNRGDEFEYAVKRMNGLPVKRPKAAEAYAYGWKQTTLESHEP